MTQLMQSTICWRDELPNEIDGLIALEAHALKNHQLDEATKMSCAFQVSC